MAQAATHGSLAGGVRGGWVGDGAWARADADRVAAMIAAGNARRIYGLSDG